MAGLNVPRWPGPQSSRNPLAGPSSAPYLGPARGEGCRPWGQEPGLRKRAFIPPPRRSPPRSRPWPQAMGLSSC